MFRFLYLLPVLLCLFARVSAGEPGGRVLVASARVEARAAIATGGGHSTEAREFFQITRVSIPSGLGSCVLKSCVFSGGIGGLLYTVEAGATTHNLYNSRGDVICQTSAAGAVTYGAQYEAFGTRKAETGTAKGRQKANTKDEDPTGLLNEGFRYRDLEAGVFLTRDPLGFVDGPNVYTYVRQNPWSAFDPEGLESHGVVIDWAWNFGRSAGGVGVGAVTGVVSSVVELPSNLVNITTELYEISQHDGNVISSSAKDTAIETVGEVKDAVVDLGEKVASGDANAIGEVAGTIVVAVVAKKYAGKGKGGTHGDAPSTKSSGPSAASADHAAKSRVLWTGGDEAMESATKFAKANNAKTLEMTLTGKSLNALTKLTDYKYTRGLWDMASKRFAKGAEGLVNVFFNAKKAHAGSTFARKELPELIKKKSDVIYNVVE